MAPGSALGESEEPIGGLVKVRPDMKSGLSFFWHCLHPGHCGQSAPRFLDCAPFTNCLEKHVGKGDRRTRRGKIYAGSFGKSRPKDPKAGKSTKPAAAAAAPSRPAARPARPAAKKAKAS